MQRRIYGHATDVEIRPLNEEKAVQAAVDLLGEVFIFTVCYISILMFPLLLIQASCCLIQQVSSGDVELVMLVNCIFME